MGLELNGFSTSIGGISWNKTTSSKELFTHLLFFLESKRILVNPIELEFKDWCIESVLEIKKQLVNITQEMKLKDFDADRIRNLIDALSAHNKQDAKRYVQQMRFVINDVWGASKNMLNEMVAAVSDATGQVADKTHRVSIANQLIIKAKMNCVEKK